MHFETRLDCLHEYAANVLGGQHLCGRGQRMLPQSGLRWRTSRRWPPYNVLCAPAVAMQLVFVRWLAGWLAAWLAAWLAGWLG